MELRGTVVRERLGAGTKSERDAVLLILPDGRKLQLRVRGGNPLRDPRLDALVGKVIVGAGAISGSMAILDEEPRPLPPAGT